MTAQPAFRDNPGKWYLGERERILADRDLTPEAKKRKIDEAAAKVRSENKARNQKTDADEQARMNVATRALHRPPGGHTAESRALREKLKAEFRRPDAVSRAMADAAATGDDLTLWALGSIATDNALSPIPRVADQWRGVRDAWAQHDPSRSAQLGQLDDTAASRRSLTQRLIDSMKPEISQDYYREHGDTYQPEPDSRDDLTPDAQRQADWMDRFFPHRTGS